MRKITWFMVVVVAAVLVTYGCKKAAQKPVEEEVVVEEAQIDVKGIQPSEKSTSIAKALCKKFSECDPSQKEALDQCVTETSVGIEALFKAKTSAPSDGDVQNCVASIEKGSCQDIIASTEPPAGCEFLK